MSHTRDQRQKETTPQYRQEYQRIFGRKKGEPKAPKPKGTYKKAKRGA